MILLVTAFSIYLAALVGIGLYSYQRAASSKDFLLGGRGISYWVTAISAHASDMSSWLFFGFPTAIYVGGLTQCWAAVGLLLGMWATWHFIAPRLRVQTEKSRSMTLTHFLAHSTDDKSGWVALTSSALLIFFFVFYIAAGLKGIGTVISFAFGIPFLTGVVCSALVVMAYTMLGGYVAVALTDTFQGIFLLAMLMLVPIVTAYNMPSAKLFGSFSPSTISFLPDFSFASISAAFITALSWGLGYVGMPHILTKFMSIDSVKNMKKAQTVGLSWQFLALSSSAAIGVLARSYFVHVPAKAEHVFMNMVMEQFTPLLAGFVLCAILAATISTLDSQLIVCATVMVKDVYTPRSQKAHVFFTRVSIALLTALGTYIALSDAHSLHEIVRYAWAGLGSTFGPLVVMSLYRPKRITSRRALLAMLVGGVIAALWPHYSPFYPDAALIPGFASGILILL